MSREQFKARHFSAEGMQVVDDSHYAGLEMAKPGQVQQWHQGLQVVPQGGYHSDARTPTQWHDAPPVAPQGYYQGDVRKSPAENEGLQFAPAYPSTPSPMIAMPAIPMVAMPTEKPWEREPGGYQTPRQGTPASKSENGYTGFPEKQNMYGAATAELGVKTSIEYTAPPEGVKKKRICGLKKSWFFYIGLIVLVIVIIAVIVGVVTVTRKKSTSDRYYTPQTFIAIKGHFIDTVAATRMQLLVSRRARAPTSLPLQYPHPGHHKVHQLKIQLLRHPKPPLHPPAPNQIQIHQLQQLRHQQPRQSNPLQQRPPKQARLWMHPRQ